jgi:hypothetical protein
VREREKVSLKNLNQQKNAFTDIFRIGTHTAAAAAAAL